MKHWHKVKAGSCNGKHGMFDKFAQDLKVDPAVTVLANSVPCSFSISLETHVGYDES